MCTNVIINYCTKYMYLHVHIYMLAELTYMQCCGQDDCEILNVLMFLMYVM